MPRPTDVAGVQRLNGFVNYLAKFLPGLSDVMAPIRQLTRKDVPWTWSSAQENALARMKQLVSDTLVLRYYDPERELTIQCDASQTGLGAALLQNGQPLAFVSRALTVAETRYAQIEKELLAAVRACEKFNQYTFGRHTTVISDHRPLERILKKALSTAPKRLQGMLMRLQKYDIDLIYVPGKNLLLADTLEGILADDRRTAQRLRASTCSTTPSHHRYEAGSDPRSNRRGLGHDNTEEHDPTRLA